ncbi:MAG: hypothetical protein K0U21_08000 [Proteobacteria bacterium]|nr:hypothetical protein [Pseudomonadota bacterium]
MKIAAASIGLTLAGIVYVHTALADGNNAIDPIPELKDIEKVAAEQEAAIRAQSEALEKAQQEKAAAEKAATEALEKQKAAKLAEEAQQKQVTPTPPAKPHKKKVTKKVAAKQPEKVSPWLEQERRYSYP